MCHGYRLRERRVSAQLLDFFLLTCLLRVTIYGP